MHSLALTLGFTAALYGFLFRYLILWLALILPIPPALFVPIAMVAAWLVARSLARRLAADDSPPDGVALALVVAAGAYLFLNLLQTWRYFPIVELKDWFMLAALVLTVRYLNPRAMLFLGVLAFATQLGLTKLLGLLFGLISFPDWIIFILNLAVAAYVAYWLCFLPDVVSNRIRNPGVLWLFGAAGVATMLVDADVLMFRLWTESLIWLSYLVSFLQLVRHIGEGEGEPDGELAESGLLVTMFFALYLAFASVFHVQEMVISLLPFSALANWHVWLPMLVCLALAAGTLKVLRLPQRVDNGAPGRKALLWGTIFLVVTILLGGSIFGASDSRQSHVIDFIGALVALAIVVGPFAVAAQFLLGVGLLRQVFNLRPPPRD